MPTRITNASAIDACNAIADKLDQGPAAGYYEIRTGSQPAGADFAATGTLLVTITLQDPAYGSASDANPGGRASIQGTPSASASAAGTAGWFRGYDSTSTPIIDGSCGASGSGADMELDNVSIANGQTVTITTSSITMPEA